MVLVKFGQMGGISSQNLTPNQMKANFGRSSQILAWRPFDTHRKQPKRISFFLTILISKGRKLEFCGSYRMPSRKCPKLDHGHLANCVTILKTYRGNKQARQQYSAVALKLSQT